MSSSPSLFSRPFLPRPLLSRPSGVLAGLVFSLAAVPGVRAAGIDTTAASTPLVVPVSIPANVTPEMLQAAGTRAAEWGQASGARGVRFEVAIDSRALEVRMTGRLPAGAPRVFAGEKGRFGLAALARDGAPFTQAADLGDTAFVLPEAPSVEALRAYLELMGHFGRTIGGAVHAAPLQHAVVSPREVDRVAARHLIVIGEDFDQPLLHSWAHHQSLQVDDGMVRVATARSGLSRLIRAPDAAALAAQGTALTLARSSVGKPQAWIATFSSPLDSERVVVMLGASGGARLSALTGDIVDPARRDGVRGDYYLQAAGLSAFHASGRTAFADVPAAPMALDQWYAVPLGLLILVTGFGLLIMAALAVARGVREGTMLLGRLRVRLAAVMDSGRTATGAAGRALPPARPAIAGTGSMG